MKGIEFLGSSLRTVRKFPALGKREAGYQLDRVQHDLDPTDWKPMKSVGRGGGYEKYVSSMKGSIA